MVNVDSTGEWQLTDNQANDEDPAWSPDGTRFAFHCKRDGHVDVYVMEADGSFAPQQLTHNADIDQDRAPAWRPGRPDPDPAQ